jgi:hypothetical protein
MSADFVIEHLKGILSYVHDDNQPKSNAILFVHFDDGADAYARHDGYLHRFIGRVPQEVFEIISSVCTRAFVTFIPRNLVEDTYEVALVHWADKEIQASMTVEIAAMWSLAARKYGLDDVSEAWGKEILTQQLSAAFQSGGHQEPFSALVGVKHNLGGNGPFGEFNEVIGQPIGGLAGARMKDALNDFVSTVLVRN